MPLVQVSRPYHPCQDQFNNIGRTPLMEILPLVSSNRRLTPLGWVRLHIQL